MRVITFKLPEEVIEALDRYAAMHNMTRSEVIRLALVKLISMGENTYNYVRIKKVFIK